ncbi:MAG: type II secretion system F family protein [Anaerolineae bacterium]|nr:type II secretion system F family protein [Anaerolineae bacterium]
MDSPILLSVTAFLSIFIFFLGLQRVLTAQTQEIGSRLDQYARRVVAQAEATKGEEETTRLRGLERFLGSDATKKLAIELGRADLKLTPSEFIAINILAVVFGFLLLLVLGRGSLIVGLVGGILGFYAPRLWIRQLQARRLNAFNNQLGDTLILLSNSLRSGYSLLQSMETVSRELPPPMSTEFARVVREIGLGLTIEEALAHMLQRIQSDDLDLVVTAINIQHEVGGNLAEILDTIAYTIRERVRIKGQIRAMTAQQRFSGYVVSLLPFVLGFAMFVINPNYIGRMFNEPCGIIMLMVGGLMIVAGYMVIRQITNIEV